MSKKIKCIIGLEIHAQMNTKSKIFCSCPVKEAPPNTNVCPTCLGYPGTKPRLNKKVFENGVKIAKALNCKTKKEVFFSRKSYFYPDMTKNFQITQYEIPAGEEGFLKFKWKDEEVKINITRVHLEEDPGKLVHKGGSITSSDYTLIDYNRAGTPLVEIVTEPDFTHPGQVRGFLNKLRAILEHLNVYDSSMIMKADANISVKGGERVEVKNITGFSNIMKALDYEYNRQRVMAKQGVFIKQQETRAFDENSKITKKLRVKETEADYGYIFEPDLSWQVLDDKRRERIYNDMSELPDERVDRFVKEYNLNEEVSNVLVYTDKSLADFFEKTANKVKDYELLANWTSTHLLKCLNYNNESIKKSKITPELFAEFLNAIKKGDLTERLGKELIKDLVSEGKSVKKLMKEKSIKLLSKKELKKIVKKVVKNNLKAVNDYKKGKKDSINFLIGKVLRECKFQAEVNKVRRMIKKVIKEK